MRTKLLNCCVLVAVVLIAGASCGGDDSPTEPTPPACSYAISPGNLSFGSQGGSGTVTVTAAAGCDWNVTGGNGWITITGGGSGNGPGSVAYAVAANTSTESRSGTLTLGGQSHTVTQEGRAPTVCNYDVSPAGADYGKDAASGTIAVSAPADCAWSATSNASWLTVTSGNQGTGGGTVAYGVARNGDANDRTGTITVADRTFTVRQQGDYPAPACDYSVAPVDLRPCMPGGTITATITTQAHCSWTASSDSGWLGVNGTSGTGSAVLTITFSDNYDAPRTGIVMVRWPTPTAGQNIHIAQAGCLYAVSRNAIGIPAAGGTSTFDVIQQSDPIICGGATQDRCLWTARSDAAWITITSSMPRSGDNPVAFSVTPNESTSARVGTITVRDKTVVITQAGR